MEVKLLSGALGAEIRGINLKDSSKENWELINNLMLEHKVLFFRDQDITCDEQINLAKKFGPLEKHVYVKSLKDYPEIIRIIKGADEKHQWGETWHTDVSYNPKPTKVIILRSRKIPPVGGDTMFSNMEIAYETLDNEIKKKIEGKKAIHSSLGAAAFVDKYTEMEGNGIDMDNKESDEILKKIFEHQERLDFTCRFKWTENAVAIWDNRSTQHQGLTDFFPGRGLGHERIMDRIAIEGDHPQ